jgi:hypothetical protein
MNIKFILFISIIAGQSAFAGTDISAQAKRLYMSLTGATPTAAEQKLIATKISSGQSIEAAKDIIDSKNGVTSNGLFYNVTAKNFAAPWSNVEYTQMTPLTDLTATVIGWIRDEKQFNQILYSDSVYVANGIKMAGNIVSTSTTASNPLIYSTEKSSCGGIATCTFCNTPTTINGRILFIDPSNPNSTTKLCRFTSMTQSDFQSKVTNDAYYLPHLDTTLSTSIIKSTNQMYEDIDALSLNLSDPRLLVEKSQAVRLHQDTNAIAGLFTTRAWGYSNYTAGTNRRSFQSTMKHFFCKNMMDINDTNTPDIRVHRDVDRSPGGSSATFKSLCVGCHAVMDPQVGAYAYYDFPNGAITYTQGVVVDKMNHNALFPQGYISQDDSWLNLSTTGQNSTFGWGTQTGGNGLKSLAAMYSETKEFQRCMAKTVYKTVCFKDASTTDELATLNNLINSIQTDNFNLKMLFARTSVSCMGK